MTSPMVAVVWALLGVGWLALLLAPLRYRAAWITARTCAMLVALVAAWWWLGERPLAIGLALWPQPIAMLAWLQLASLSLFVGSWMVEDAPLHAIPHRVTAPLLLATALSGPVGWGVYMLIRDWYKWGATQSEP